MYDGFFKLSLVKLKHELFKGGESELISRELIKRGDAVGVLPYDPVRDELVFVEQFRVGALNDPDGPWLMEIIAGYKEPNETAEDVAIREAQEEADCQLDKLQLIHRYYSSAGGCDEQIHVYFALTNTEGIGGIHGLEEESEDIKVHVVSADQAMAWLDQGKIDSAMPIIALQWFRRERQRIRQEYFA